MNMSRYVCVSVVALVEPSDGVVEIGPAMKKVRKPPA